MSGDQNDRSGEQQGGGQQGSQRQGQQRQAQQRQGQRGQQGQRRQGQQRQGQQRQQQQQGQRRQRGTQGRQGGRRGGPPSGGGGPGLFGGPSGKRYLGGMVGALVALAIAVGLMVIMFGAVGGPEMTPDTEQELTDEQRQQQQDQFVRGHVQIGMFVLPYVGLAAITVLGLVGGITLPGDTQSKAAVAAAGAFVGGLLFLVVGDFILSTQFSVPEGGFVTEQSLAFSNLLINAVVVGVLGAGLGAVGAVVGDRASSGA